MNPLDRADTLDPYRTRGGDRVQAPLLSEFLAASDLDTFLHESLHPSLAVEANDLVASSKDHLIDYLIPPFDPPGILQANLRSDIHLALCVPTLMRGDDDFGMGPERVVVRKRFWVRDVQSCAEKAVFLVQCVDQVLCVNISDVTRTGVLMERSVCEKGVRT
jgi:hypothetical protein